MPNKTFDIRGFNAGLITSTDIEDIPRDAASFCYDLDPSTNGVLQGIVSNETPATIGTGIISLMEYLNNDGSYVLVTNNTSGGITSATSMVPHNNEIHAGMGAGALAGNTPQWYGYIKLAQFKGKNPAIGLIQTDAPIENVWDGVNNFMTNASLQDSNSPVLDSDFFKNGKWEYTFTTVYDGYQESPLPEDGFYTATVNGTTSYGKLTIDIEIDDATAAGGFNPRITSFNAYRRDILNGIPSSWNLIKSVSVNDTTWQTPPGTLVIYTLTDEGSFGSTFEQNTGYAETLENINVNYELGVECAGYHFVSNIYNAELGDMPGLVTRSFADRFDMFDWSNFALKMPFTPLALASFQDRLYAMGESRIVRINPSGFYIESESPGVGCSSPNSYVATKFGMFFANQENIFMHNGSEVLTVSTDIEDAWRTASAGETPILSYDASKQEIICAVGYDFFMYHVTRKRWDRMTIANIGQGGFSFSARTQTQGGNSVLAYDDSGKYIIPFSGGSQQAWNWTSGEFSMGETQQDKIIYKIKSTYTGTPTILYYIDGGSGQSVTESTGVLAGGIAKFKKVKVLVNGAAADTVNNIEIIYRPLVGKR